MATKLKSITRNSAVKVIAFVLAAVFAVSSLWYAFAACVGFFIFESYDKLPFEQTLAFRELFNVFEEEILCHDIAAYYKDAEEYLKTPAGKKYIAQTKEEADAARDGFEYLQSMRETCFVPCPDLDYEFYCYDIDEYCIARYVMYYKKGSVIIFDEKGNSEYLGENAKRELDLPEIAENIATQENLTTTYINVASEEKTKISPAYVSKTAPENHTDVTLPETIPAVTEAETKPVEIYDETTYYEIYDTPPKRVSKALRRIYDLKYFVFDDDSAAPYNGNEDIEALINEYIEKKSNNVRVGYRDEFTEYKNVKFIIFCTDDYAVSNFADTKDLKNDGSIAKLFESCSYAEAYSNGSYSVIKGEPVKESQSKYKSLHDAIVGPGHNSLKYMEEGGYEYTAVYVGYENVGEKDNLSLAHDLYDKYNRVFPELEATRMLCMIYAVLALLTIVYLVIVAGKKKEGEVKLLATDKIPFLINMIITLGIAAACVAGIVALSYVFFDFAEELILNFTGLWVAIVTALALLAVSMLLSLLLIFVRNLRAKTFIKNTLTAKVGKPIVKLLKKVFRVVFKPLYNLVAAIKTSVAENYYGGNGQKFRLISSIAVAVFLFLNGLFCIVSGYARDGFLVFLMILVNAAILVYCIIIIYSMDSVMSVVSKTKNGEKPVVKEFKFMPGFMKRFMQDVLSIQEGLANAVDSAVKDQKMKTELITNVSHDLKTPLTSIVNYVDLLKRCEVEDEQAKQYIEILDDKSQKLKKLIEDLVEASKASSGAVELHLMKLDLCEIAAQTVGEHEDELKAAGIEIILKTPENETFVIADSQKTSRIIENLFSNIRKYALENTRVYVEINSGSEYCTMTIKNISKYPLNMSAQELTQRFVRGESSRAGEGSGLGLSIAENLCTLQNGKFNVSVDGDLFKVTIALPKAE